MPNYKQIKEDLIPQLKPFKHGHSMRAELSADTYSIYSYSTLVATYDLSTGEWWFTDHKYSQTTTRQMNVVKVAAGFGVSDSARQNAVRDLARSVLI